jgi:chemotaxis protein CheZ
MMANQSFQDLTGQTLKKVINFVESLQFKLIELLPNYGNFQETQSADVTESEEKEESGPLQSQEKVDQMLADLGF